MVISSFDNVKVKEGGGGRTIRIGATGKVSALMMQELDAHINVTSSNKPDMIKSHRRIQTAPVSMDCGGSAKRLQRMMSGSSSNNNVVNSKKKKNMKEQLSQKIPMLDSEDLWIDQTPIRGEEQQHKKVTQRIVETVDLKCGKHEGDWSIGNQLRRLSFSKVSD